MSVSPLRGYLRKSEPIAALLSEIERRECLLFSVRRLLPAPLAGHCRQATIEGGQLRLLVDSPVWVDRLRLIAPELIDALRANGGANGIEIETCRVRAAPEVDLTSNCDQAGATRRAFNPTLAVGCLQQAAASVGHAALAQALRRLALSCQPTSAAAMVPTDAAAPRPETGVLSQGRPPQGVEP